MPQARLYVAIYRAVHGNYEHCALYLENGTEHKIYEVVGEHLQFQPNVVSGKPTSTSRHKKNIGVDDISANDVKELEKVISLAAVKNSVVHWNCQDYVLEILDKLAEECIVDEDEEEYKNARKYLKNIYGAMI